MMRKFLSLKLDVYSINLALQIYFGCLVGGKLWKVMFWMYCRFYNNAYYARVGGVSTAELNRMEMKFLFSLDFRLQVNVKTFHKFCSQLEKEATEGLQIERPIQACKVEEKWSNTGDSACVPASARWKQQIISLSFELCMLLIIVHRCPCWFWTWWLIITVAACSLTLLDFVWYYYSIWVALYFFLLFYDVHCLPFGHPFLSVLSLFFEPHFSLWFHQNLKTWAYMYQFEEHKMQILLAASDWLHKMQIILAASDWLNQASAISKAPYRMASSPQLA